MSLSLLHSIALSAGQRMVNSVLEGMLIAALVWLLLRAAPGSNSRTRFAVWFLTFVGITALPFAIWNSAGNFVASGRVPHVTVSASWAIYALYIWIALSAFGIGRILFGLWHIRALRRECQELKMADLPPQIRQSMADFAAVRRLKVCVSDDVKTPTAVGFFRPAVLLPRWTIEKLSESELNAVLLHEFGHLVRRDDWTNLLQKVVGALLFFHPAVWWIDSQLCLEREAACDDLVLAKLPDAKAYAECLVSVAEKSVLQRGVSLAVAAVGRVRQTATRLLRILDTNRANGTSVSRGTLGLAGAMSVIAFTLFPHIPALVEFQNGPPSAIITATTATRSQEAGVRSNLRLAATSESSARPAISPAAMNSNALFTTDARIQRPEESKVIRVAQKQHARTAPQVTRASLVVPERESTASPMLLVLVQGGVFDLSDTSIPFASESGSAVVLDIAADQRTTGKGTIRVFRLTIFSGPNVLRSGVVSNVI